MQIQGKGFWCGPDYHWKLGLPGFANFLADCSGFFGARQDLLGNIVLMFFYFDQNPEWLTFLEVFLFFCFNKMALP